MRRVLCRTLLPIASAAVVAASLACLQVAALGAPTSEADQRAHAARRSAVREAAKSAVVLLRAPVESDLDRTRFRTDNNVMYLTGMDDPGIWLALLPDGDPLGQREIVFVPRSSMWQRRWPTDAAGLTAAVRRDTGIAAAALTTGMWDALRPSIERAGTVYVGGAVDLGGREGSLAARVKEIKADAQVVPAASLVNPLRWRKGPEEVQHVRAAVAATVTGMRAGAGALGAGVTELAVEGAIIAGFRRAGSDREGFPCIVGSGPNGVDLHHFAADREMQPGELVVVDIGAEWRYYSADLTRTFPVDGKFTARQRALYQLVLDTQKACEQAFRPGETTLRDLHTRAMDFLRSSPLRARDRNGTELKMDAFMLHYLGHSLGMDVHDVMSGNQVLVPGTVFTIEPGVYIESEGIGVRIEDDYLVTETGLEKLSKALPSSVAEVEAMVRATRR